MAENDKLIAVMALVAGIAIGANWDKIKENVGPLLSSFTQQASQVGEKGAKFMAEQKENVEDTLAAAKIAAAKKSMQQTAAEGASAEFERSAIPIQAVQPDSEVIIKRRKSTSADRLSVHEAILPKKPQELPGNVSVNNIIVESTSM